MIKWILIIMLNLQILAFAVEKLEPNFVENPSQTKELGGIVLNAAVMHEIGDNITNGFRPKNALVVKGEGETLKMRLYTVYFNTNKNISSGHIQKVVLVNPDETKIVFSGEDRLVFESLEGNYGSFQRAYLDQTLVFPEMNPGIAKNFGFYKLLIFLDKRLMKVFLVPIKTL